MAMFIRRYLVEGIARICLDCFFRVENLYSGLDWLDPVTAAVKRRSFPEGVVVEEHRRPYGVLR